MMVKTKGDDKPKGSGMSSEKKKRLSKFLSDRKKLIRNKSDKEMEGRGMVKISEGNYTIKKKK